VPIVEATRVHKHSPATGYAVERVADPFLPVTSANAGLRTDRQIGSLEDLEFLGADDRALLARIRTRTSLRMLALVARVIAASRTSLEGRFPAPRADIAPLLQAAARYRDIEIAVGAGMSIGYAFAPRFGDLLAFVVERADWSIAALSCHTLVSMRAFSLPHHARFARPDAVVHRIGEGGELTLNLSINEWRRVNAGLADAQRDAAVDDLIVLLQGIDALLLFQVDEDVRYLMHGRRFTPRQIDDVSAGLLTEYRTTHIDAGLRNGAFAQVLRSLVTPGRAHRLRVEVTERRAPAS